MEYMYIKWKMTAKARNLNLGKRAMMRSVGVQRSYTRCVSCGLGIAVLEVELWSSRAWSRGCKPAREPEWAVGGSWSCGGSSNWILVLHDSLATGGKGGKLHEGPTSTDLQTFWWASRARKEKKMLSARRFQMSAMLMESGASCHCSNAASHHGLLAQVPGYTCMQGLGTWMACH